LSGKGVFHTNKELSKPINGIHEELKKILKPSQPLRTSIPRATFQIHGEHQYHNSGNLPSSCLLFQKTHWFRD
jgi:hypothetical protein